MDSLSIAESSSIIDSLQHVDNATEEQLDLARHLVEEEMEILTPRDDYLDTLPGLDIRPFCTDIITAAHSRLETEQDEQHANSVRDLSCIQLDIPPPPGTITEKAGLEAWTKCLNQMRVKLEYRLRQISNLEDIRNHDQVASEKYLNTLTEMECDMRNELRALVDQINATEDNRKGDQEKIRKSLNILQNRWNDLVQRNETLYEEINKLKTKT